MEPLSVLKSKGALLWIGEQKRPIQKDRETDFVMDSVINYYNDEDPKLNYRAGSLFLDNGAYTARMQNKELDIEKVISVQESINPDLTIPLDYPFLPKTPEHIMSGLWDRTANNITYWQESTSLKGRLVPSLHSWDKTSLKKNLAWLQKHADTNLIALGSIVDSSFAQFEGIFGDRQPTKELVDMVSFALSVIEKESDFSVHLMGWGSSPLMLHLGYYLGMKSMDTMGYRRKAAFGKIVLPGRGERHIGETSSVFGGRQLNGLDTPGDLALLQDCKCPICQSNQLLLLSDWKARAIHNEWVMKQEARTAESFLEIGRDVYEKYLDKAVFATSSLQYLWDYTKLRVKYHRISDTLFG